MYLLKANFLKVSRYKKVLFYVGPRDILMGSIARWNQTVPISPRDETRHFGARAQMGEFSALTNSSSTIDSCCDDGRRWNTD